MIHGSFVERDLQLKVSYASSQLCVRVMSHDSRMYVCVMCLYTTTTKRRSADCEGRDEGRVYVGYVGMMSHERVAH